MSYIDRSGIAIQGQRKSKPHVQRADGRIGDDSEIPPRGTEWLGACCTKYSVNVFLHMAILGRLACLVQPSRLQLIDSSQYPFTNVVNHHWE